MLAGKSVEHVHQNKGRVYSKSGLKGYYNDMTEKVTMDMSLLGSKRLPLVKQSDGNGILFPVAIFQYALGCYDLWLIKNDDIYKDKFLQCADWTLNNMDGYGRWDNFSFIYPNAPYGAMAQGEGASVLLRAYMLTRNDAFLAAAQSAIDFMLKDIKEGGTTSYDNNKVILCEYTNQPVVMNGWIFAWWGLYDYVLLTKDNGQYKNILNKSLNSLVSDLPIFKSTIWSLYDKDRKYTSPFYHNLHIAQMQVMYDLTGIDIFNEYAKCWKRQQQNIFCKFFAFIIKAWQKIIE